MKLFLLSCGHVLKLDSKKDKNGNYYEIVSGKRPMCDRCGQGSVIDRKLKTQYDGLEGRFAVCGEKKVRSSWLLPGFVYCPEEENDKFLWSNRSYVRDTHGSQPVPVPISDPSALSNPSDLPEKKRRPRTEWFETFIEKEKKK